MIRAVIFDFGGVLCFHPEQEKIDRAAAACGMAPEPFWNAMWRLRLEYDAGRLEPDEYWRLTLGDAYRDELLPAMIRHEVEFWNRFDQRVFDWIGQLRDAGLKIGLLSNLPRVLAEELRATRGFLENFDWYTFSYELRCAKPATAIYEHSVRGLGIEPAQGLFLDDKIENVEGARVAGLQAELFANWEEFKASGAISRYSLPEPA